MGSAGAQLRGGVGLVRADKAQIGPAAARHTGRLAQGSAGFTLVELLIALALIALITLLLFSGLSLGSRAWEAVETAAERNAEHRTARSLLARILPQARTTTMRLEEGVRLAFAGERERLEFVGPLVHQVGVPGLYLLRLSLVERDAGRALILTRWLLHPEVLVGGAEFPAWEPLPDAASLGLGSPEPDRDRAAGAYGTTLLLDGVEALEISYFGILPGEAEGEWLEEWIEQPRLPERIRIRLQTTTGAWPDLSVDLPQGDQG